ncbi:pirin family protein [Reyranella sp.]|uniref:pirin family protein n=1 Tax=Reyranella sp. TaxID=1929291 RepID=UPI003BA88339
MNAATETRRIAARLPAQRVIDDGAMRLFRGLPAPGRDSVGPFVFVDHYRSTSARGIGDRPHPHAGIEVLSYLLEGGVEHRDSMGFRDRLGAGDAQWIRAGRGILHAEQPQGGRHGLQLWTSLPPAEKLAEPTYRSFRAADIPEIRRPGAQVRVIAGSVEGIAGPMVLATPTVFAHVELAAGASTTLAVDADQELGLYVLAGGVKIGDGTVGTGELAVLTPGASMTLAADGAQAATAALIGGRPAEGPILFAGPFVMDTPERLVQARQDYLAGRMGRLEGVPF